MKFKHIFSAMACALLLSTATTSCLDMEPKESLADTNLWQSADDYRLFSNQFYSWLRGFGGSVSSGPHSDYRSDLISMNDRNIYSNGTNPIPTSDGNFTTAYTRLRQINMLLTNVSSYPHFDDIAQSVGEAYFFRAYVYFDLLQLYGDALIVTSPLDIDSPELNRPRNSRTEVTDFILDDLKNAIAYLPTAKSMNGSHRVSREAAQAFAARVALYEGTWQKFHNNDIPRSSKLLEVARNYAKAVMDARYFWLFQPSALGTEAYKYLFTLENTKCNPANLTKNDNHEYILVDEHDADVTGGSTGTIPASVFIGHSAFVTRKFANMFLGSDGLPIDPADASRYSTMNSEYRNRDNRMTNILIEPGTPVWTTRKGRISWQNDATDLAVAFTQSFDTKFLSGYFSQKWNCERQLNGDPGYDYPVIRYAEVLLTYTEAVFELIDNGESGNLDEALTLGLNLVRKRVNPQMPALTVAFATSNGLDMRTEIRRERTIELFHEGFRIDDLKRWNQAIIEMPKNLTGVKYTGTEYADQWLNQVRPLDADGCIVLESGRTWDKKNNLYPIPIDQLQLHPNLGQNPYWN